MITQNVQFVPTDQFANLEEQQKPSTAGEVRINKRIRSLRKWKKTAKKAGLRVKCVVRTPSAPEIFTPENNVLILERQTGG
jgi:hypothetical protein